MAQTDVGRDVLAVAAVVAVMALSPAHRALASEVTIVVEVDTRALPGEKSPGQVEVMVAEAATREIVARHTLGELPATIAAVVPETASGWVVEATAPDWWAPATRVAADDRGASVALVPMGRVRFQLDGRDVGVSGLDSESVRIVGRLWNPGKRLERGVYGGSCSVDVKDDTPEAEVSCPFARDEKADLHVSLGAFLPWARAGVTVGRDSNFGVVPPVRGAGVFGSLRTPAGEGPFLLALAPRNGALPVTSWTDGFGAFGFEGLAAGTWDLYMEESPNDRWTVRVESLLDQVDLGEITSAATNRFALDVFAPTSILEGLEASAYRIRFGDDGRPDGNLMARYMAERSFEGSLTFNWSGLPAGHYRIFLEGLWGSRWHTEVVEFGDAGRHVVDLDLLVVRGRIRRGGEPLEDVLIWFGGLNGGERVVLRSREGGRFEGFLPRRETWGEHAGSWAFQVTPAPACDPCEGDWIWGGWRDFDPRQSAIGGAVEVVEGSDGVARVDIDLPNGHIEGRLVRLDPQGRTHGVAGARVEFAAGQRWAFGTSQAAAEDGSFEFTGVPDAVVSLRGEAHVDGQILRSDPVELRVSEDEPVKDLDIVLRPQRRIRFLVRSRGSAVARAVAVLRYRDPGRGVVRERGLTGTDGSVGFWLSGSSGPVELVVHAEGLGTDGWRGGAPFAEDAEIELSDARGDLVLPGPAGSMDGAIVSTKGVVMHLQALRANGQVREWESRDLVRNLAPGRYSWCPAPGECNEAVVIADTFNVIRNP